MKLIHNFKSKNFNDRKSNKIELIIIHYTALCSASKAIKYLCSKKNKVSCHYLISQNGKIYSLVSDKKRAWHAGKSYWNGEEDINSISIGIELDFSPLSKNNKFTKQLISSLLIVVKKLQTKYKILPHNILGHSDISPYRKIDPGNKFPWIKLGFNNSYDHVFVSKNILLIKKLIKQWFVKNKFRSKHKKILFMLNFIGYDISLAVNNTFYFKMLIQAYSNRKQLSKNNYFNKRKIFNAIELHFYNIILTKIKK